MKLLCGGYGSGKTYTLIAECFKHHINNKGKDGKSNGWVIYPTYQLAEEVFIQPFLELLERKSIEIRMIKYFILF